MLKLGTNGCGTPSPSAEVHHAHVPPASARTCIVDVRMANRNSSSSGVEPKRIAAARTAGAAAAKMYARIRVIWRVGQRDYT